MSKKQKAKKIAFRERFLQNEQRGQNRRKRIDQKSFQQGKIGLTVLLLMFGGAAVFFGLYGDIASACFGISLFLIGLAFYYNLVVCHNPEGKIRKGNDIERWMVKKKPGRFLKYSLPADQMEMNNLAIAFITCYFLATTFGVITLASFFSLTYCLCDSTQTISTKLYMIIICCFSGGVGGIGLFGFALALKRFRNEWKGTISLQYRKPKTIVETENYPLRIGEEAKFWVEQQGTFKNCHLEFYLVLTKTEAYHKSHESRIECANYLVEVMTEAGDITPDNPMRHEFTTVLSPEDYVPSVWHSFVHSGSDRYDWVLRVRLISDAELLVCRNFPVVLC